MYGPNVVVMALVLAVRRFQKEGLVEISNERTILQTMLNTSDRQNRMLEV